MWGGMEIMRWNEEDEPETGVKSMHHRPPLGATKRSASIGADSGIVAGGGCFTRPGAPRSLTAYERIVYDCNHDEKWAKEITLGKRVSFYRFKSDIGSGNFSQVKSAVHQLTKEKVAVKILDKTKLDHKTQRMLSREISNMDKLVHPNIIRLFQVVETLTRIHLVMEYAGGGELFAYITNKGKLPEDEAKMVFSQLVSAVGYMHESNMVHRDIKAENVFYVSPRWVKIGDLGFSISVASQEQQLKTFCGSPPYAAPELFQDDSYSGRPVDVWALAVLLYFMVTGLMPFRAQTVAALKKLIVAGAYSIPETMPDGCRDIVSSVLVQDPKSRPNLADLRSHCWLAGAGGACRLNYTSEEAHALSMKEMHRLGISEETWLAAEPRGNRSSVVGIYRIIVTRLQNKRISSSSRGPGPGPGPGPTATADPSPQNSGLKSSASAGNTAASRIGSCLNQKQSLLQRVSIKSKTCVVQ